MNLDVCSLFIVYHSLVSWNVKNLIADVLVHVVLTCEYICVLCNVFIHCVLFKVQYLPRVQYFISDQGPGEFPNLILQETLINFLMSCRVFHRFRSYLIKILDSFVMFSCHINLMRERIERMVKEQMFTTAMMGCYN